MIRPSFPLARVVCLFSALSSWSVAATVHTGTFMAGNGTTDDTVGFQNAINAAGNGGTVIVDQPPNFYLLNGTSAGGNCGGYASAVSITQPVTITSQLLFTNTPGAPSGAPMLKTNNGSSMAFFICDTSNNVTVTGLIFDSASGIYMYGWNLSADEITNNNFSHNTVQNVTGAGTSQAAISWGGILNNSTIGYNLVHNIWQTPNGVPGYPGENASLLFPGQCYNTPNGEGCASKGYGIAGTYLNHTTITSNKIWLVGGDGISEDVAGVAFQTIEPSDGGYNTITDNELIGVGRIGMEFVGGGASNENYNIVPDHNTIVSGNFYHDPTYMSWLSYAFSLVMNGAWNFQQYNNTGVENNSDCFGGHSGDAFEFGLNSGITQGNVLKSLPGGCGQQGWGGYYTLGDGKLQTINTTGNFDIFQNNYACGPGASIGDEAGGITMGGPGSTNSNPGHAAWTQQANAIIQSCPTYDPAGMIASNMSLAFTSSPGQTINGSGTFNLSVSDTVSVRHVNFYIDGSTTPVVTQSIQDYNSAYSASNLKWLYHATINSSSLTNGTHTIKAVATDVTGTDSTPLTQAFTVTGSSGTTGTCAITTSTLPSGTVGSPYTATLAQSGCGSGNWSIASGGLNGGLTLNATTGVISGTPTAAGTSTFTVAFSTALSSSALSITINAAVVGSCNTGTQNTVNGLYADTFSGNCVGNWWSLQDPVGGATANVGGSGLSITVPAGSAHDGYTSGDNAAVLIQPLLNNADFSVTAEFTSTPATGTVPSGRCDAD